MTPIQEYKRVGDKVIRWMRFGVLGQYAYAKAMLYRISTDPQLPQSMRQRANKIQSDLEKLIEDYKGTLK